MRWGEEDFSGGQRGYVGPPLDELALKIQEKMARFGGKRILLILVVILVGVWLASGIYAVGPGSELLKYFRSPRLSSK